MLCAGTSLFWSRACNCGRAELAAAVTSQALLLGSDYTEGVAGVGIVNAMEIVQSFETLEGISNCVPIRMIQSL